MTNQHPITPPTELVREWCAHSNKYETYDQFWNHIATQAAQWGADAELDACCWWLNKEINTGWCLDPQLRAARRPKPPSLKEQALALVSHDFSNQPCLSEEGYALIRRALEALPND
jgi:hypothetical protein